MIMQGTSSLLITAMWFGTPCCVCLMLGASAYAIRTFMVDAVTVFILAILCYYQITLLHYVTLL